MCVYAYTTECVLKSFGSIQLSPARYYWHITALLGSVLFYSMDLTSRMIDEREHYIIGLRCGKDSRNFWKTCKVMEQFGLKIQHTHHQTPPAGPSPGCCQPLWEPGRCSSLHLIAGPKRCLDLHSEPLKSDFLPEQVDLEKAGPEESRKTINLRSEIVAA